MEKKISIKLKNKKYIVEVNSNKLCINKLRKTKIKKYNHSKKKEYGYIYNISLIPTHIYLYK